MTLLRLLSALDIDIQKLPVCGNLHLFTGNREFLRFRLHALIAEVVEKLLDPDHVPADPAAAP